MATAKDAIMSRSGPEDRFYARPERVNTSAEVTAGPDWGVYVQESIRLGDLYYKDDGEMRRLHATLVSPTPAGEILRDTAKARYICYKQIYTYDVSGHHAHAPGGRLRACIHQSVCCAEVSRR